MSLQSPRDVSPSARARNLVVLIISNTVLGQELYDSSHYEVILSRNVEHALLLLATCEVDVIFIEMSLVSLALECSRRIREATKGARLPIVLVGNPNDELENNIDECIRGPLRPQDVLEVMADIVLLHAHIDESRAAKTIRIPRFSVSM